MGIFSGIGKFLKRTWKGIKKGFKKVLGVVGKALNSKLGKVLMMAVSVFTAGAAFVAAQGAFAAASAAGSSFISSFIQGGAAFVKTLVGMKTQDAGATSGAKLAAESMAGAAPEVGQVAAGADVAAQATGAATGAAENALSMGGALKTGVGEAAIPAASNMGTAAGTMEGVGGVLQAGKDAVAAAGNTVAGAAPAAAKQGWLSRAASAAMDFAKSDSGQNLIGSALQGYGKADEMKQYRDLVMRGPNSFREGSSGMKKLDAVDYNVDVPAGMTAQKIGRETGNAGRYQQRVPYQQQPAGG